MFLALIERKRKLAKLHGKAFLRRGHGTGRRLVLLGLWLVLLFGSATQIQAQTNISIDGAGTGKVFEGVGAVSAGGASRLLIDYPEPYRSEILDYLFKPYFGASLQHLKVEIGGDENSTAGSEPTHMLSATDMNYTRGYEWWLMQQAQNRNPTIALDALEWGAPGWIGGGQFFSQDNINYILNFVNGAKSTYGLTVGSVGIWDEAPYDITWIKNLKAGLQGNGLTTKVVAADQCCGNQWAIADDMSADSGLMSAVDILGAHYPGAASTTTAQNLGKSLWDSEDWAGHADWGGAQAIAQILLGNYPGGKITKTELWALISSYYDIPHLLDAGLMLANTPWSGNFTVEPPIWAVAHVTQFAQPGWRYIDSACGSLTGGIGSYITLVSPDGSDYSTILQTAGAFGSQTVTFTIKNGLSTGAVHVWMSNSSAQFIQQSDITPSGGTFSITLAPDSIYSLTTTTGQTKGNLTPPSSSPFPFPYADSFDQYASGATPLYFTDYAGQFETANCGGSRSGLCLRQVAATSPIVWPGAATTEPETFIGDVTWTDYQETVDALFEQPGSSVKLYGRLSSIRQTDGYVFGYHLDYDTSGNWSLSAANQLIASGVTAAPGLNTWHTLSIVFAGSWVQAAIDGNTLANVFDTTFTAGLGGLGTTWANAQFDNFTIDSVPGTAPVMVLPPIVTLGASQSEQFTASVAGGNNQVSWSITPNVGGITSGGLYTAPAFVATSQTVTVTATSAADSTQSGTAVVTLAPVWIGLNPQTAAIGTGQTQQFNAEVTGSANTAVTWSVSPNVGTISSQGLYTAPNPVNAQQVVTVTATSVADTTKTASATLTLSSIPIPVISQQPQNAIANAGQTATFTVSASGSGLSYQWEAQTPGGSSFAPVAGATGSSYTTPVTTLAQTGAQYLCVVSNSAGSTPSNAATLTVVASVPTTNFVTSFSLGTARNDFTGWVGMSITVGPSPVTVTALGRIVASGNTGSHTVKIVNASTSQDVAGSSVSVPTSGGTAGTFAYANLPSSVILNANTAYYIMSQETSGGDIWYDMNTTIQTTGIAAATSVVYSYDGASYSGFASANQSYGPVGFLYSIAVQPVITQQPQNQTVVLGATAAFSVTASGSGLTYQWQIEAAGGAGFTNVGGATGSSYTTGVTQLTDSGTQYRCVVTDSAGSTLSNAATLTVVASLPATNYITSFGLGTERNNFTGWVGMSITVGSSPVTVTALGRIVAAGNTVSHIVKIVNAASSQDVTGGSVSIPTSGGTVGTLAYENLASSVTLNANSTYYIMSQETQGGDTWYDVNTTVQTTSVAVENTGIYSYDGASYSAYGSASRSYGPVGFLYSIAAAAQPAITQQPQSQTVSPGITATFSVSATGGTLSYQWSSAPSGSSTFTAISGATGSSYTTPATTLAQSGTQYMCAVSNGNGSVNSSAATLTVTGGASGTYFVTSESLGTLRNNYTGFVGMNITVGAAPITVTALGRMVAGSNGGSHLVKIVQASTGADVAGASASVNVGAGTPGTFAYGTLSSPVTLSANTAYYVVTQETSGGDSWYDFSNTSVQTTSAGTATSAVYSNATSYVTLGSPGQTYGPVDFLYGGTSGGGSPAITQQPQSQTVSPGITATFSVSATGGTLSYQWSSAPSGSSTFTAISGATGSSYTTPATTLAQSGTQYMCAVSNGNGSVNSSAATLTVTGGASGTYFVTSESLGTLRNNYTGFVGMNITVGAAPITVTALGRMVAGSNGGSHLVKIVQASTGTDVAGASVTVNVATGTPGTFAYATLSSPVTLSANTAYYVVTQETFGGDSWYDFSNTSVQTTSAGTATSAVYSNGTSYVTLGSPGQTYGPVDFLYGGTSGGGSPAITQQPQSQTVSAGITATFSVGATGGTLSYQWSSAPSGSSTFTTISGATGSSYTTPATTVAQSGSQYMCAVSNGNGSVNSSAATLTVTEGGSGTYFVTSESLGTLRNNYTGFVGMNITVGAAPITVTALGRMVAGSNGGNHLVKIVQASTGTDVPGASVTVNVATGTPGTFAYATLSSPVTLSANTAYYVVTQETFGGDPWYDYDSSVQTTSAATVTSAVYSSGSSYVTLGSTAHTYGPVSLQY
jgi:hypothetical protein